MSRLVVLRIIAVMVWSVALFEVWGGQYIYRQALPDGRWNSYTASMYWWLPPQKTPRACRFLDRPPVALALPCGLRPTFIPAIRDWLDKR